MSRKASSDNETLLRRLPEAIAPPPMIVQPGVEHLDSAVTLSRDTVFPFPDFANAIYDDNKRRRPQCIAHRGYRARFPENTLAAFCGAVKAGAHALETDIHLTKDEVVVLSHDATLKRCFGRPEKIIDCNWDEIKDRRTLAAPHEPMPRLKDVLDYLNEPGLEDIWLMLDIKLDNDANNVMRLISSTIASVPAKNGKPWQERIVLGIWAAKFLPLAQKYSPGFPVCHISFSTLSARHFFTIPNIGVSMYFPSILTPWGRRFIREAQHTHHRQTFSWTINTEKRMEWCIRRGLSGVVTDDPVLFLEVCDKYDDDRPESLFALDWHAYYEVARMCVWIGLFAWPMFKALRPVASQNLIQKRPAETQS